MSDSQVVNVNGSMPTATVAADSKPVSTRESGTQDRPELMITLKFELPEYAEGHPNGRFICVDGKTSQEALLEAVNAIAFISQHISNPKAFHRIAPEQGDHFDGWQNMMGIRKIPGRKLF
jgi:hypothetical protein